MNQEAKQPCPNMDTYARTLNYHALKDIAVTRGLVGYSRMNRGQMLAWVTKNCQSLLHKEWQRRLENAHKRALRAGEMLYAFYSENGEGWKDAETKQDWQNRQDDAEDEYAKLWCMVNATNTMG